MEMMFHNIARNRPHRAMYNAHMESASENTAQKMERLTEILEDAGRVAVAFSGGTDSTFLLAFAHKVLGNDAIGITISTPLIPDEDMAFAKEFCRERDIEHIVIEVDALACEDVRLNPPDRCYHCKKLDMGAVIEKAKELGAVACDGANVDDAGDYRPGMKAAAELGILSPMAEAGLTKREIREQSRELDIPNWDKPASACLASRIPYGIALDAETLRRIGKAEELLRAKGFPQVRVRAHGDLARIEVPAEQIEAICASPTREHVDDALRNLGFAYVTCDMQGYRMGSLNEALDL